MLTFSLVFLRKKTAKETEWDSMVGRKTIDQEWGANDSKNDVILAKSLFFALPFNPHL